MKVSTGIRIKNRQKSHKRDQNTTRIDMRPGSRETSRDLDGQYPFTDGSHRTPSRNGNATAKTSTGTTMINGF